MSDTSGAAIRRRIFLVSLAFLVPLVAPSARAQFLVAPQYPIALGGGGGGVATADFNHDDKIDLVFSPNGGLYASVALGNGDGTFQTPVEYPTGGFGYSDTVAVADFNGDGNPDIAIVSADPHPPDQLRDRHPHLRLLHDGHDLLDREPFPLHSAKSSFVGFCRKLALKLD